MSGSLPFAHSRHAHSSKLVAYLTVAYLLLVVYASLYPFANWRVPNDEAARFLFAGWPSYVVAADVVLNILAYAPLGLLLTLLCMERMPRWLAVVLSLAAGALLSLAIEFAQAYLPTRIASIDDVLTNTAGTLAGAAMAFACGERWLLSGELRRLRQAHFGAGARTDVAFVLLALWLLTQFNAEIWLFGNGNLRHLIPASIGVRYSADNYLLLEAGVAALNFAGVAFLTSAIARSLSAAAVAVTALTLTALTLKTIASMALFVPGNPGLWLTPGSALGLVAGVMLWLPLAGGRQARAIRASAICFAGGLFLVNLAPENPYLVAALQVLQRGQFLRFNAMTDLLSSWWPFLALAYLVFLMRSDHWDQPRSGLPRN